jgi:hypothetical protein
MSDNNNSVSKSWFCVFDNPAKHGFAGDPEEIAEKIVDTWIAENPKRTCAVTYCISASGLHHCHAVLEDTTALRFSAIKKLFPSMHIEPTKGNKKQADDYINKRGRWAEEGETVYCLRRHGEIKGRQGQRNELLEIERLIDLGRTPDEIMDISLSYRRYEKLIRKAYIRKRYKETPRIRNVKVVWHVGKSGSGKSYEAIKLAEIHGDEKIYEVAEYENGFMDKYSAEPILFMDEYRGETTYNFLLLLLGYKKLQYHSRFENGYTLWSEVHVTSVYPPDMIYDMMVKRDRKIDTYRQLQRRITDIVYHYEKGGEFLTYQIPMSEYTTYEELEARAMEGSAS